MAQDPLTLLCVEPRFPASQRGLLTGVLIYDLAAAAVLAYAGLFLDMAGLALWPAVALHAALAFWCVVCIWDWPRAGRSGPPIHENMKPVSRDKEGDG
jgi:hypothetical protein